MTPFLSSAVFILLLVGGYYSFFVLPRQRAYRKQYKLVSDMKVGDEVITMGGIVGKIKKMDTDTGLVTLEIAPGTEMRFVAMAINQKFDPDALADSAERAVR